MNNTKTVTLPLNRVEGDLEVLLKLEDGVVSDASCIGTMYRGFENLMRGRSSLDGLVITPRICGICSTAHLKAAAKALDAAFGAQVPDNGKRVRNVTMMVEQLQNDIRHSFLLFAPDFTRPPHARLPLFDEAVRRYRPLTGETVVHTIRETKKLLEIIAILGGQWPHSSFMVPGGVVSVASATEINQCRSLLSNFRRWYESRVLGCRLERWQAVRSPEDLDRWLEESDRHRDSDVGFFIRIGRQAGLDRIGEGPPHFISYGALEMPNDTVVKPLKTGDSRFMPAGFVKEGVCRRFDPDLIAEHVACSHLTGYEGGRHPYDGITQPADRPVPDERKSWAKAPRYEGLPAETGPLAEFVVAGHPLFTGLLRAGAASVLVRQLARLVRPVVLLPAIDRWLTEITTSGMGFYQDVAPVENGRGFGLTEAHRGALGHWIRIERGRIASYQVVTPTAWNLSPRDGSGVCGPCEQALIGITVENEQDPIAVEHVVRSFDPCLVCTVHCIRGDELGPPKP